MTVLHFFESIRSPFGDAFFGILTYLGDEIGMLAIALLFFWCLDKRSGYYLFLVGFVGTLCNQFLKLVFRVDRPWVAHPDFTPVGSAIEAATGYSFPSGHTQASVGLFGGIALIAKKKLLRWGCILLAVLVPLSRLYLGVHYPADVIFSAALALLLLFVLRPLVAPDRPRRMFLLLGAVTLLSLAYLLFVLLYAFPSDTDPQNLSSGLKNAYTLLGVLLGLDLVYLLDATCLPISTAAPLPGQILKYTVGLLLALGIKEGLRAPLTALFGAGPQNLVRYFLLVIFAGILFPRFFPLFAHIGNSPAEAPDANVPDP